MQARNINTGIYKAVYCQSFLFFFCNSCLHLISFTNAYWTQVREWPKVHQRAFCFSSRSPHGPSLRMLHEPLPGARIWNVSTDKWTPCSSQTSGFCSFSFRLHSFIRSHTGCKLKLHCKNGILGNESQFEIALLSFLWNRKKQREWAGEYPYDAGVLFLFFLNRCFFCFRQI